MMSEEIHEERRMYRLAKNRFVILIIGSILISLGLVMVALGLYARSGAAQLDLSRPGYSEVRTQVKEDDQEFKAFPGLGPIDEESLALFEKLYKKTAAQTTQTEVFHSEALSDEALRINDTSLTLED